jgi:hypothetical protein
MTKRRNMRRIMVRCVCPSAGNVGPPIIGLFEVSVHIDGLHAQMRQASRNKSRISCDGALIVTYTDCGEARLAWALKQASEKGDLWTM